MNAKCKAAAATDPKPSAAAERTADQARAANDLDRKWPTHAHPFPFASRGDDAPFSVVCVKASGSEVVFARYQTRAEAERIAQHLQAIGCAAHIVEAKPAGAP